MKNNTNQPKKITFSFLCVLLLFSCKYVQAQSICDYNNQEGFNMGIEYSDEPFEVFEQDNGSFVIWGTSSVPGNSFHISGLRLFPNGNIDPSFGVMGKVDQVFSQRNTVTSAAMQSDGKFLVAGYQSISNSISTFRPYVARFNVDGSLDESFGEAGVFLMENTQGVAHAIRYFDNGKIKFMVLTEGEFFVVSLLNDGTLDDNFGVSGLVQNSMPDISFFSIGPSSSIFSDSSCVVVGKSNSNPNHILVGKTNPDGTMDVDFGVDGNVMLTNETLYSTVDLRSHQANDGNILVTGTNSDFEIFVAKINSTNGELVTDFGDNGIVHVPWVFGSGINYINSIINDETTGDYLLLVGNNVAATVRMSEDGELTSECGDVFNILDMNGVGTQGFTAGMIDSQGIIRLTGTTSVHELPVNETQFANFMWAYYEEQFDPVIYTAAPNVIQLNVPVEVYIYGIGFEAALDVRLIAGFQELVAESFEIIDNETIRAIFYPENITLGPKNIEIFLEGSSIILEQGITIDNNYYIDGEVNVISRTSLRSGPEYAFGLSYRNKSSITMIATPLVIISEGDYHIDVTSGTTFDYQEEIEFFELANYFNSQGIDPSILNSSIVSSDSVRTINAVITMSLPPGQGGVVYGTQSIASVGGSQMSAFLNPNPIVPPEALLPSYFPNPSPCSMETTKKALLALIPDLDTTNFENCFLGAYQSMQLQLAVQAANNNHSSIPYNSYIMKLLFDMMQCMDPSYLLTQQEFIDFATYLALYRANTFILSDGTICNVFLGIEEDAQPELDQVVNGNEENGSGNGGTGGSGEGNGGNGNEGNGNGTGGVTCYCDSVGYGYETICVELDNGLSIPISLCQLDCFLQNYNVIDLFECNVDPCEPDEEGNIALLCVEVDGVCAQVTLCQYEELITTTTAEVKIVECNPNVIDPIANCNTPVCVRLVDDSGNEHYFQVDVCNLWVVAKIFATLEIVDCNSSQEVVDIFSYSDGCEYVSNFCIEVNSNLILYIDNCFDSFFIDPLLTPFDIPSEIIEDCEEPQDHSCDSETPEDYSGNAPGDGGAADSCDDCQTNNDVDVQTSLDPNEKLGPYSSASGSYINDPAMFYSIHFENVDTAVLAASTVFIVDTIDISKLDTSTFKFTFVNWGNTIIPVDDEVMTIDLRPEMPNFLRITTAFDPLIGRATWLFETLDTLNMTPTQEVDQGFLPPNITPPEGMGFVSFEVDLLEDLEQGTVINNQGYIYFDYNEVIATNTWSNVYDPVAPESEVNDNITFESLSNVVNVTWESQDDDVMFYNIYYNEDGSDDWLLWKYHISNTNALFSGELGNTYYFVSIAIDSTYNVEPFPETYDAFVFMNPVTVEEFSEDSNTSHRISIYPNPASQQVLISVDDNNFSQIVMVDMMGRKIHTISNKNQLKQYLISLEAISSGIYHIQLLGNDGILIDSRSLVVF